jgi:hypothetical protein
MRTIIRLEKQQGGQYVDIASFTFTAASSRSSGAAGKAGAAQRSSREACASSSQKIYGRRQSLSERC